MKRIILKSFILISMFSLCIFFGVFTKSYSADFKDVTPQEAVKNMSPGWNLGNTLEATPTEESWGNPPVREYTFDDIKKSGFRTVRIPVTWSQYMGPGPDYRIDPPRMDRIEQVVDWALERDLYVVLNTHHDDWVFQMAIDPETGKYVNNYDNNIVRFEKLWEQIAERFNGKREKLIFELMNEPVQGEWISHLEKPTDPKNPRIKYHFTPKQMNDMNSSILKIIRSSGGYNDKRLVMLCGLRCDSIKTLKFFKAPDDKYIILTVHYYRPWDFVANRGVTRWGAKEEKDYLNNIFEQLHSKFIKKGLPIVIGEWGTTAKNDRLSRWYYHYYIANTAYRYGMPCILWDNGSELFEYFDRKNRYWRDEILKDITINACNGIPNSFIFPMDNYFKMNTDVTEDLTVKLELNGNELFDIYNWERKLVRETDYIVDTQSSTVIIKKDYLVKLLDTTELGTVATLKFDFSKGIDMPLNIIRYDLPKFPESMITIDKGKTGGEVQSDITIPVLFNGTKLDKVTLVDKENKKPVIKDWTPYLWISDRGDDSFDYNDTGIILQKGVLNALKTDSLFTFEFYPEDIKVEMDAFVIYSSVMLTVSKNDKN